jgi:hypothetical protein
MNRLPLFAIIVLAAGCTTYKLWTESGSDSDAGLLQLSYEYRKYESPQPDEREAIQMARERCRDWRFTDAHRKGEKRECIDGTEANCSRWRVTREYRCTK